MDLKPGHHGGYSPAHADNCERVLVTLMRGMGPYRASLILVGGLVPRYLVGRTETSASETAPVAHVGTTDVDLLLDITILAKVEAYRTLTGNLKAMGFERDQNDDGNSVHYRWRRRMEDGTTVLIDFLQDSGAPTGDVTSLPRQKGISALNIEGARMARALHHPREITAELLDGGVTVEVINIIDVAPFIAMKALAFDDRAEAKDAYDLVYTLLHYPAGRAEIARGYQDLLADDDLGALAQRALDILRKRFVSDGVADGHRKDGCVAYARFLTDAARREQDTLNARTAAAVVREFVDLVSRQSA